MYQTVVLCVRGQIQLRKMAAQKNAIIIGKRGAHHQDDQIYGKKYVRRYGSGGKARYIFKRPRNGHPEPYGR